MAASKVARRIRNCRFRVPGPRWSRLNLLSAKRPSSLRSVRSSSWEGLRERDGECHFSSIPSRDVCRGRIRSLLGLLLRSSLCELHLNSRLCLHFRSQPRCQRVQCSLQRLCGVSAQLHCIIELWFKPTLARQCNCVYVADLLLSVIGNNRPCIDQRSSLGP